MTVTLWFSVLGLGLSFASAGQAGGAPSQDVWPANSAALSDSLWPGGRQPRPLSLWKRDAIGTVAPCWKTSIVSDLASGWPAQCQGLTRMGSDAVGLAECQASCLQNPMCSVWQFNPATRCWQGAGQNCQSRGAQDVQITGAQRYQHGDIKVLMDLYGLEIMGLKGIGLWQTGNVTDGLLNCQRLCFSDLNCQFWVYGTNGCWVEDEGHHPEYPLTTSMSSRTSPFATTMVKGQYIQHVCPTQPPLPAGVYNPSKEVEGLEKAQGKNYFWTYIVSFSFLLCFVACLTFAICDHNWHVNRMLKKQCLGDDIPVSPDDDNLSTIAMDNDAQGQHTRGLQKDHTDDWGWPSSPGNSFPMVHSTPLDLSQVRYQQIQQNRTPQTAPALVQQRPTAPPLQRQSPPGSISLTPPQSYQSGLPTPPQQYRGVAPVRGPGSPVGSYQISAPQPQARSFMR